MSKTVTLRLKNEVYNAFLEAARANNRSLSNLIETAALCKIQEQQFADDSEMAEIMANQDLLNTCPISFSLCLCLSPIFHFS